MSVISGRDALFTGLSFNRDSADSGSRFELHFLFKV